MKKLILAVGLGVALAAPASTALGANDKSAARCEATIDRQTAKGTTAGGGPKAGIPAPTNCDHFYQEEGLIGGGK